MKKYVHVKTQGEWDEVTKFYNIKWSGKAYPAYNCINLNTINSCTSLKFANENGGYMSFEEWQSINNITKEPIYEPF